MRYIVCRQCKGVKRCGCGGRYVCLHVGLLFSKESILSNFAICLSTGRMTNCRLKNCPMGSRRTKTQPEICPSTGRMTNCRLKNCPMGSRRTKTQSEICLSTGRMTNCRLENCPMGSRRTKIQSEICLSTGRMTNYRLENCPMGSRKTIFSLKMLGRKFRQCFSTSERAGAIVVARLAHCR